MMLIMRESKIIDVSINEGEFSCPLCGISLVPPVAEYCEHVAFYCVQGPADKIKK